MISLFPLGTTLFPGGLLPLKIFEPRYLSMTRRAFQSGEPFGIVALKSGSETLTPQAGEALHEMGVMAHIEEFEEFNPALFLIRVRGGARFQIDKAERSPDGIWRAQVDWIEPDPEVEVPQELEASAKQLGALIRSLQAHGVREQDMPFSKPYRLDDCSWVSNRWSEMLPLQPAQKQTLLGQTHPRIRLDLVSEILEGLKISVDFPSEP
jgi:uncharacterized protein